MRIYRFMSQEELDRYLAGETLENRTEWEREMHNRSSSVGFCFFGDDDPIESRLRYLSGVVDFTVIAEFEADNRKLEQSVGWYRDLSKDDGISWPVPTRAVKEYCTKRYSRESFRLIRAGTVMQSGWKWEIKWTSDGSEDGKPVRSIRRRRGKEARKDEQTD